MSINQKAKIIFSQNYIGSIATVNPDGSPWSSPVHMYSDDEYVYWLSKPNKQHSQNIERDARTHLSLFSPEVSRGLQGVYIKGQAEHYAVAGSSQQLAVFEAMQARVTPEKMPANMDQSDAYRLKIGQVDEEKSTGNCWYFYS